MSRGKRLPSFVSCFPTIDHLEMFLSFSCICFLRATTVRVLPPLTTHALEVTIAPPDPAPITDVLQATTAHRIPALITHVPQDTTVHRTLVPTIHVQLESTILILLSLLATHVLAASTKTPLLKLHARFAQG
jgi:hypothetical protein